MKHRVYISQFTGDEKRRYEKAITSLGGVFEENLKLTTNVLITKNVLSDKYNVGQILKANFLSQKWLDDSITANQFLQFEGYTLGIFEGIEVGIIGFSQEEYSEIVIRFLRY